MTSSNTTSTPDPVYALLEGPAYPPPLGVTPDFQNSPNLDNFVVVALTLCITFATVAFFIRMYTKIFLIRSLAAEDCKLPLR